MLRKSEWANEYLKHEAKLDVKNASQSLRDYQKSVLHIVEEAARLGALKSAKKDRSTN
jgi:hypothetical protein